MSKISLTNKLFMAIFSFGLIIFVILICINLKLTANEIITQNNSSIYTTITQSNQFINNTLTDLEQTAKKIALNKDILFSGDKFAISKLLWDNLNLSPVNIQDLYFYYDENMYSNHQALLDIYGNNHLRAIASEMKYTPYLVWNDPYSTLISQNTIPLSYCIGSKDDYGILFIDLNTDAIKQHFEDLYENKQVDYIVISNKNNIPLSYHFSDQTQTIDSVIEGLLSISSVPEVPAPVFLKGTRYMFFKAVPHQAISFYILYQQHLYKILSPLIFNFLFMVCVFLFLMLFVSYWIAKKITTPLIQFTNELQRACQKNNLPDTISNSYSGEIYVMVESYNDLANRISSLVAEKERNIREKNAYEKQALQHQIGPHFLRNTLICIGSLVKQNRNYEALPTLQSLLNLLSYSFDNSLELVTLQNEIDSILSFAQILQIRYDQKFQLEIDIESKYLQYQIPKLILQPVVENAIYHGIVPKKVDGIIEIHGYEENDFFFLDVSDNGIGMENPADNTEVKADKSGNFSIGLANVIKRVQLQYGNDSKVIIKSTFGLGTTVRFQLPSL